MELTDRQWKLISRHLSRPVGRTDGKGRPRLNDRIIFEGILWILRSGARWKDLPGLYPSKATCHRRFQEWCRDGSFQKAWEAMIRTLDRKGRIDWEESFIDASFVSAKKGAYSSDRQDAARVLDGLRLLRAVGVFPLEYQWRALIQVKSSSYNPRLQPSQDRRSQED
jgi:transposase